MGYGKLTRDTGFTASLIMSDDGFTPAVIPTVVQDSSGNYFLGTTSNKTDGSDAAYVYKYSSTGVEDAAWTANQGTGFVLTGVTYYAFISRIVVLPNGKVVAGGRWTSFNGVAKPPIIAFNTDGTIDSDFATNTASQNWTDIQNLIHHEYDVKDPSWSTKDYIIGAGQSPSGNGCKWLDATAGFTFGWERLSKNIGTTQMTGLNLSDYTLHGNYPASKRYKSDATLSEDTAYTGTSLNNEILEMSVDSGDTCYVLGVFSTPTTRIASFNADGTVNTTFDVGTGLSNSTGDPNFRTRDVQILDSGKIFLGGTVGGGTDTYNGTVVSKFYKLNTDGSIHIDYGLGSPPLTSVGQTVFDSGDETKAVMTGYWNEGGSSQWNFFGVDTDETDFYEGAIVSNSQLCPDIIPPINIFTSPPTGGSGNYTYQWMSGETASPTTPIVGATGNTYTPAVNPPVGDTWYYRVLVDEGEWSKYTNDITKFTYAPLGAGSIAADQTIPEGSVPDALTITQAPSGASGSYSYFVYSGLTSDPYGMTYIEPWASGTTYQPPAIYQDTYYSRRIVNSFCGTVFTDPVLISMAGQAPPTNVQAITSGITYTTIPITWDNHNNETGYNSIQVNDLSYGSTGGAYVEKGTTTWSGTSFTITGLKPFALYEIRVVLIGSEYPSIPIQAQTLAAPPPICSTDPIVTMTDTTCGAQTGYATLDNPDYLLFYDILMRDLAGNYFPFSSGGTSTTMVAGWYALQASPKAAYEDYYGSEQCIKLWYEVLNPDAPMALDNISIRNVVCGGFGDVKGRFVYFFSDTGTTSTYEFNLYKEFGDETDAELVWTEAGLTEAEINQLVIAPLGVGKYYGVLYNETTDCIILTGMHQILGESLRATSGIKRVFVTEWNNLVEYNYWSDSDEDYFVSGLDPQFFNSIKIKTFIDATLPSAWFEIVLDTKGVTYAQTMNKTHQGFIFTDTITITIPHADNAKWKQLVDFLVNRYIVVFEDTNDQWWVMGYRLGAQVDSYKRESNEYVLVMNAISNNKIVTNLDEEYVINNIINP